jgi:LacI family transcriptional regulator
MSMNIAKIAELCGVSVSTVSRILNNKPDVNPQTRDRVISLMNEFGFRPTIVAGRHETAGLVLPLVSNKEFIGELITGITESAFAFGRNVTIIPPRSKELQDIDNIAHYCRSHGLSGLMVINPLLSSRLPHALRDNRIPHLIVAGTYRDTDISWIDVDNVGGSKEAVNHLIALGHRRIAMFHGKLNDACGRDRLQGYREAMVEAGFGHDPTLELEDSLGGQSLGSALLPMLRSANPPTAIFVSTYRKTLRVLNCLQEAGLHVPGDISVAGFGDYDVSLLTDPPITSVHQPVYEMGKRAIAMFDELANQSEYEQQSYMLPTELIVRKSTDKPKVKKPNR